MSVRAKAVRAARQSPFVQRIAAMIRRLAGTNPHHESTQDQRIVGLELAIADILAALQDVQGPRLGAIERHLPILLNTIASGHGTTRRTQREFAAMLERESDLARSLTDLWARIETIRRELMFEVRYNDRPTSVASISEPKVVDEAKLAAARASGLRVNLGCGHVPLDGYVNVDLRELPGVDVIAPVDRLPFEPGEIDELYSSHLVEHFPEERLVREVLPHWVSRIRPGGTFRAVLPDAGAMLAGFADGSVPYADLREVLYGGQEYEGDFHFNMYTPASLREILVAAGLEDVLVEAEGRRNGACLEMQISARRPG